MGGSAVSVGQSTWGVIMHRRHASIDRTTNSESGIHTHDPRLAINIIHYRVSYLPNARRQSHQPTSHQARELHKWISVDDDGRWHRFGSSNECGCWTLWHEWLCIKCIQSKVIHCNRDIAPTNDRRAMIESMAWWRKVTGKRIMADDDDDNDQGAKGIIIGLLRSCLRGMSQWVTCRQIGDLN